MAQNKKQKALGFTAPEPLREYLLSNGFSISINFSRREVWEHDSGFKISAGRPPYWNNGQLIDTPEKLQTLFAAVMGKKL